MDKLNELLAKYGKTMEDITFDIEGLSDEELETRFTEVFEDTGDDNMSDDSETNTGDLDESFDGEDSGDGEDGSDDDEQEPETSTEEKFTKTFTIELSHEDVRYALYNLIGMYEEEDNEWYSIRSVYDNYFYMQGWSTNKLYKVNYTVDCGNVSLDGERQEMFEIIVSESEKLSIEKMREDYSALEAKYNELQSFKDNYDAVQLKTKKDAIFAKEEFASILETKAFKKLVENSDNYTVEECEQKARDILDDCNDYVASFVAADTANKSKVLGLNFNKKESKEGPYGKLFSKN